jgi:SAM-dependent methyltransferase
VTQVPARTAAAPPRSLDGAGAQRTWDGTHAGSEATIWAQLPFVARGAQVLAAATTGPVLEIPCGGGANTATLAARLPVLVAADRSAEALKLAHRVTDAANCVFLQADVYRMPLSSDSMAGVFCADLIGHLEQPERALLELIRICQAGARIIVNFFDEDDPSRHDPWMKAVGPRSYVYRDVLFRYDSVELVAELLDGLPVRPLEIKQIGWREDPHPGYRDYEHEHRSVLAILEVI